jgi:hypothetical protein
VPLQTFKIKPRTVSAEQYFPGTGVKGVIDITDKHGQCGRVLTPFGPVVISPGDWVITGEEGRYPIKKDVFSAISERVKD